MQKEDERTIFIQMMSGTAGGMALSRKKNKKLNICRKYSNVDMFANAACMCALCSCCCNEEVLQMAFAS